MSDYELQIQATGKFYDEAIRAAQQEHMKYCIASFPAVD